MNLAARMYTRSDTNETRDEYREPDVGCKNDKTCHGDEQALAIAFTGFDAEPVVLICRLNHTQKEKKPMIESSRIQEEEEKSQLPS